MNISDYYKIRSLQKNNIRIITISNIFSTFFNVNSFYFVFFKFSLYNKKCFFPITGYLISSLISFRIFSQKKVMENIFKVFKKSVFNSDYSFIIRYIPIMSALGFALHIFFYFFLKHIAGLDESLILRLFSGFLLIIHPVILRHQLTKLYEKVIYETALIVLMPFYFSYMTLVNDINMFWATATGFCGFFYGLLSKPYIMPVGYIIGIMCASIAYSLNYTFDPELLQANFFLQPVSFFPALIAASLIIALEHSYKQIIEMKTDQISLLET